jgi:hypothetical protein
VSSREGAQKRRAEGGCSFRALDRAPWALANLLHHRAALFGLPGGAWVECRDRMGPARMLDGRGGHRSRLTTVKAGATRDA